jgi:hypothetical protein
MISFDNSPDVTHLPADDREAALVQHRLFEGLLLAQPDGVLHRAVAPPHIYGLPRQTLAHLIVKYTHRRRVALDDLLASVTQAGGDPALPGFVVDQTVNLLALDDDALYKLYMLIPSVNRPPKRAKPVRHDVERRRRRRVRFDGTVVLTRPRPKPAPVFRPARWVACDSCGKWRRLLGQGELPTSWTCGDHPDGITCDTPVEAMEEDEQWDGATEGATEGAAATDSEPSQEPSLEPSEMGEGEGEDEGDDDDVDDVDLWGDEEF